LALGTYPEVSAVRARDKAARAREAIAAGEDPSELKRQQKAAERLKGETNFKQVAAKLVAKKKLAGKANTTISKMEWILKKVDRGLGSRPITSITTLEIVKCLAKEELAGNYETARRMRNVLGEVFRFAQRSRRIQTNPLLRLRGHRFLGTVYRVRL
jgi:integrase